ncbi:MAG TPA: DUF2188 domain-containing protein [Candidatus Polarisedimenticolia bacterium]|nr:DUF2188 domain-containing protein [Candidatus Polarisedimenticolia bacterium]
MPNIPRYTLTYDDAKRKWALLEDGTGEICDEFDTKEEAIGGGGVAKALGPEGGSVKIKDRTGRFEEERTYPRSADPRRRAG